MSAGVLASAVCYLVAIAAEIAGPVDAGSIVRDPATLLEGLRALDARSWASAGTYVLVITPAVGLVITAAEYAGVGDRGTTSLALLVLAVLALSGAVALLA